MPGVKLGKLLLAAGEPLLEPVTGGLDVLVRGVGIFDPGSGAFTGELVLLAGVRGRDAVRSVRAAARAGAVAVVVKTNDRLSELRAAAEDSGVALLTVGPRMRWDQLQTLLREVLDAASLTAESTSEGGDLFSLAQTVAVLTAGSVTIEDAGNRVLAYSRSDDEIDELRRLSILGWEGPEQYLSLLREWGVYQRLRTSEEVVTVEERPELGIRRRLAVGIRAGTQHLGTIWVAEGARPFAERAESALLGAARLAAVRLLRRRSPNLRPREDLVENLLNGRISADLVAGQLGLDPAAPVTVLAFTAREVERDRPEHELHQLELSTVVSVHATSYRRDALVGTVGARVYAVLPEAGELSTMAGDVVNVLARNGIRAQAGAGSAVLSLADVVGSRTEADRVLDAMARTGRGVATISDLRAEILLDEMLSLLAAKPELRDPAVGALVAHDASHGTELVRSLLAYFDALGDVRTTATALHVHPNTVRHRLRRASAVSGLRFDDPRERLACHLQLLGASR